MKPSKHMTRFGVVSGLAVVFAASMAAGPGFAKSGNTPMGIWIDAKGRGAVEIAPCGRNSVCGRIVWVRDKSERHGCGQMLLGDVRAVGGGEWDNGWIIDPDDRKKYDVALKRISRTKLQVTGYMGSKFFSRDLIWKLAPRGLKRCDGADNEVIEAKSDANLEIAAAGPKDAPNPERKPMLLGAASVDIIPPAPVLAAPPRLAKRRTLTVLAQDTTALDGSELSEGAREALDVLTVPADSADNEIPVLTHRQLASNKTCLIYAPFATVTYRCRR